VRGQIFPEIWCDQIEEHRHCMKRSGAFADSCDQKETKPEVMIGSGLFLRRSLENASHALHYHESITDNHARRKSSVNPNCSNVPKSENKDDRMTSSSSESDVSSEMPEEEALSLILLTVGRTCTSVLHACILVVPAAKCTVSASARNVFMFCMYRYTHTAGWARACRSSSSLRPPSWRTRGVLGTSLALS